MVNILDILDGKGIPCYYVTGGTRHSWDIFPTPDGVAYDQSGNDLPAGTRIEVAPGERAKLHPTQLERYNVVEVSADDAFYTCNQHVATADMRALEQAANALWQRLGREGGSERQTQIGTSPRVVEARQLLEQAIALIGKASECLDPDAE